MPDTGGVDAGTDGPVADGGTPDRTDGGDPAGEADVLVFTDPMVPTESGRDVPPGHLPLRAGWLVNASPPWGLQRLG